MTSHSLEDTKKFADIFVKDILTHGQGEKATVVGLYGDLGAGKTALVQAAARVFGIKENLTSPTFVIEMIYEMKDQVFERFIHIDAYRLDEAKDLEKLGFKETASDPKNIIFIEWPERVSDILPDHIRIMCRFVSEKSREYEIIFPDER